MYYFFERYMNMNFKKILCMSLAVLSVFASAVTVGAQETEVIEDKAVLAEDAELFAIKEVTSGVIIYECDTTKKTATAIGVTDAAKGVNIPATVKSGSTECKVTAIADGFCSGNVVTRYHNGANSRTLAFTKSRGCFTAYGIGHTKNAH